MKKNNRVLSLACLGLSIAFLLSCQSLKTNPKALREVRQLLLLSFYIQNATDQGNVHYPNISFIGEEFYKVFVEALQSGTASVGFVLPSADLFQSAGVALREKVLLERNLVTVPWSFRADKFSPGEIDALLKAARAEGYVSLSLTASVWEQSISGRITITDRHSKVVWDQHLRESSTYIIEDASSPYTVRMEQLFDDLENGKEHKEEVVHIYRELGRRCAELFLKSLAEKMPTREGM